MLDSRPSRPRPATLAAGYSAHPDSAPTMEADANRSTALLALSPLDGRYAKQVDRLRPLLSEAAFMAQSGARRTRMARRVVGRGFHGTAAVLDRDPRVDLENRPRLRDRRRRAHQGHRGGHQPRCQGGRILVEGTLRRRSGRGRHRTRRRERVHPLRLHIRGHQQHVAWTDDQGGARGRVAADPARHPRAAGRLRARARRRRDDVAHPRPDGEPDHGRQGIRERRRAPRGGNRTHRGGRRAGQDERRGRQLQRAPSRAYPRSRLGGVSRAERSSSERPGPGRLEPVHDPDRAARLHGGAVRRDGAR